jgi:subtilisin
MRPRLSIGIPVGLLTCLLFSFFQASIASAQGLPNLIPYQPIGWSDKIVVSNVPGSKTDSSPLKATDALYVSWAVLNSGAGPTTVRFYIKLFIDGSEKNAWYQNPPLYAGFYTYKTDYPIGSLSAGTHTLRIVADATSFVNESAEYDNEYSKTITVIETTCLSLTAKSNISLGGSVTIAQSSNCSQPGAAPAALSAINESFPSGVEASSPVSENGNAFEGSILNRDLKTAEAFRKLGEKVVQTGRVKVIVGLETQPDIAKLVTSAGLSAREDVIRPLQDRFLRSLRNYDPGLVKRLRYSPYVGLEVDAAALKALQESAEVTSIEEDTPSEPNLAQSGPLIGAAAAWASGSSGAGQTVAILDSGVNSSHPFLAGKVVSEACFSTNGVTANGSVKSLCPGQVLQSTDQNSGMNCDSTVGGCDHGTHVAGIAAGRGADFSGIAKDATLVSIQVFSRFDAAADCSNQAPCARSYRTDQLLALERVMELSNSYKIAAVNMSLGSGAYGENCDWVFPSMKAGLDQLRARGIATVISSGNESSSTGIAFPACLSNAISVGSTDDGSYDTVRDAISSYSNSAAILNLLAPGRWIRSSVPGGGYADWSGTSMAAPHVTGAWAVIRSKFPSASVDQILEALSLTGKPVTDSRNGIIKPRIQLDAALDALSGIKSGQFTYGTTVTINASANPGFRVTGWTGCDSFSGNNCTVSMTGPRAVTASFAAITLAPPVIVNSGAAAVTLISAQLNATVNPNGLSTAVNFQWGTTTAYGRATSYQITDTRSTAIPVSVPVTGLTPNTTYYYRVLASNASGSASPVTGSFTTLSGGVALPDLRVTSFSASTAAATGGQISIEAVVKNDGAGDSGIFRAGFYLSTDNVIDTGDIYTGWLCNFDTGLKAGASDSCSGSIGIPSSVLPGTYVLGVIADDTDSVIEANKENNTREADTGPLVVSRGDAVSLDVTAGGANVVSTNGVASEVRTGYAKLKVNSGSAPYGTAVFTWKQNGVVVSEAGVPASPPTTSARVFIDFRSGVPAVPGRSHAGIISTNTGIAVANNSSTSAHIAYTLRSTTGDTITTGHGELAGGNHLACFIDHLKEVAASDFNLPADFQSAIQFGSLEVSSDQPVSILALRGTTNQRNEFLITTTPIADLTRTEDAGVYFPQIVDGGGYTTSLVLLNASSRIERGLLQIMDNNGTPLAVKQAGGILGSSFSYTILPGGAFRFQTDGSPAAVRAGWVRLVSDFYSEIPIGSGIFGYNPESILVSESGIPAAVSTTHARVYVDLSRNHNTGLAIANVDSGPASIRVKAFRPDGVTEVGVSQGLLELPSGGHEAKFADRFMNGLPAGFRGVLDISAATPFAALTLRSLMNERDEFLMTTFPVADLNAPAPSPIVFPHVADGGGYLTEFILISAGGGASTILNFYDDTGSPTDFGNADGRGVR